MHVLYNSLKWLKMWKKLHKWQMRKSPAVIVKSLSHFADLQLRNKYFGRRWFVGWQLSATSWLPILDSYAALCGHTLISWKSIWWTINKISVHFCHLKMMINKLSDLLDLVKLIRIKNEVNICHSWSHFEPINWQQWKKTSW